MNEKEALTGLKNLSQIFKLCSENDVKLKDFNIMNPKAYKEAIETILDFYNKEKEKNRKLETDNIDLKEKNRLITENLSRSYIGKDIIREKIEYQNMLWNTPNRQKEYNQEVVEVLENLLEV